MAAVGLPGPVAAVAAMVATVAAVVVLATVAAAATGEWATVAAVMGLATVAAMRNIAVMMLDEDHCQNASAALMLVLATVAASLLGCATVAAGGFAALGLVASSHPCATVAALAAVAARAQLSSWATAAAVATVADRGAYTAHCCTAHWVGMLVLVVLGFAVPQSAAGGTSTAPCFVVSCSCSSACLSLVVHCVASAPPEGLVLVLRADASALHVSMPVAFVPGACHCRHCQSYLN